MGSALFGLFRPYDAALFRLSEDLPVVIEIVDTEEKIERLLPYLDEVVHEGLATMERAHVIRYRHDQGDE